MHITQKNEVEREVTTLLSELLQINTTNPPGNETVAAKYLAEQLYKEGFNCELVESAPNRGSIITRLKGTGEKPRLLLLSHLDVVAANSSEWQVEPFSGTVKDGFVWGRGALDMKGMTAIEVMVLKLLKRNNIQLKGDIILAATADEEAGSSNGVEYLVNHCPDKIFAEYVINEGGGSSLRTRTKNVFTVNTAEKGLMWFRTKAKGTPGHGSVPDAADNAILRMNKVLTILGNYRGKVEFVPTVKQFLIELMKEDPSLKEPLTRLMTNPQASDQILDELDKTAPAIADEIRPRIRMTITPTIIQGGVKENVIPSECDAVFDCRILPGQSIAQAKMIIQEMTMNARLSNITFEDIQVQEPSESPVNTPLFSAIKDVLGTFEPGCGVVPTLMTGGTDSRFFRRMGSVAYGFHPLYSETKYGEKATRREHGIDERISIDNLVFGVTVLYETVKRFLT